MPVAGARIPIGLVADRPSYTTTQLGLLYLATDVAGGTLYVCTASGWAQVAAGVSAGGGPSYDDATFDFGEGAESVTNTVADATVTADTTVTGTLAPAAGRDTDEMDLESFDISVVVTAGVGFDLICKNLTGGAHGQYIFHYAKGN